MGTYKRSCGMSLQADSSSSPSSALLPRLRIHAPLLAWISLPTQRVQMPDKKLPAKEPTQSTHYQERCSASIPCWFMLTLLPLRHSNGLRPTMGSLLQDLMETLIEKHYHALSLALHRGWQSCVNQRRIWRYLGTDALGQGVNAN